MYDLNNLDKKISNIREMFNSIAPDYDKLNNIISLNNHIFVKKRAIKNVKIAADAKVLDLCTGTGDIAIQIASEEAVKGQVIGIDFSKNMLDLAIKKGKDIHNLAFICADATDLPFKDNEFDFCTVSFGLRNIPEFKKALLEMKRVTKKGGKIVNLETGKPKGLLFLFFKLYFFYIVPFFGKLFSANSAAYKYLPESTEKFPTQEEMCKILAELGFINIEHHDYLFGAIAQQIAQVE